MLIDLETGIWVNANEIIAVQHSSSDTYKSFVITKAGKYQSKLEVKDLVERVNALHY